MFIWDKIAMISLFFILWTVAPLSLYQQKQNMVLVVINKNSCKSRDVHVIL